MTVAQAALNLRLGGPDLVLDGIFGPKTKSAVLLFQRNAGLAATGSVTVDTARKLMPMLRRGSTGSVVRAAQGLLQALGYSPRYLDGEFGPLTEAAVIRYQNAKQLEVDGIVGPQTWRSLLD